MKKSRRRARKCKTSGEKTGKQEKLDKSQGSNEKQRKGREKQKQSPKAGTTEKQEQPQRSNGKQKSSRNHREAMTSQKSNKKQIRQKITKRYIVTCLGLFVCLDPPPA